MKRYKIRFILTSQNITLFNKYCSILSEKGTVYICGDLWGDEVVFETELTTDQLKDTYFIHDYIELGSEMKKFTD